ncbi:MAG TPA: GGDEF domain-containing protein, partial [Magnetococcales bacterium]|nr:GGDEF domain-containing protein [Magnetococcales bacterium]
GYYDLAYVEKRLRIGKVHKRIGVSPKLYISALVRLEALLHREVLVAVKQENNCTQCDQKRDSLHKLLMFDVQLVFDTYINSMIAEISSARDEIEIYAESLEATVAERTAQLQELSSRDALTGLLNQRSFYNILRREISRAEKNRGPLSLVYFDLNKFKSLNDTQGHKAGDELLALVGKNTRDSVRDFDISFRYGGDEFVIIMPDTLLGAAVTVCNQMASNFDKLKNQGVTFSIGVHQMGPDRYTDMDTFVKAADAYMYQAKAESKKFPGHYVRYEGFVKEEGN